MAPPELDLGRVLVVGGCGFLGSHVVDQLLNFPSEDGLRANESRIKQSGDDSKPDNRFAFPLLRDRFPKYSKTTKVSVLDVRTANNRYPGAEYYEADIMSTEALLDVFRKVKPDVVIDTVSPSMLEGNKEMLYKVNVEGTKNLMDVAGGDKGDWGGKCRAFVYTSSASVVHDSTSDLIRADERWPLITGKLQGEYYTETKALAERAVLGFNKKSSTGMLTTALRPAGIHGERDTTVTHKLIEHAAKSSHTILTMQLGENNNLFDFTYAGNIAYAHLLAAQLLLATHDRASTGGAAPLDYERVDGEAFNITNDSPVYFWDMARAIWSLMDRIVEPKEVWALSEGMLTVVGGLLEAGYAIFTGGTKKPRLTRREVRYSCMTRFFSCEKAKVGLKYLPLVPLEESVARSVGYYLERDQGIRAKKAT